MILESLGIQAEESGLQKCFDAYQSSANTCEVMEKTREDKDEEEDDLMTLEDWEETKDVFFMLRIPFEIDASEECKERFTKALTKRHRKCGRYGPQGGFPIG